jgi:hypothetical protein
MARRLPRGFQHVEEDTVFNFLLGLAIGWLAGSWYSKGGGNQSVPVEEMRRRAATALEESERLVEESKRELQAAVHGTGKPAHRPKRSRRPRPSPGND